MTCLSVATVGMVESCGIALDDMTSGISMGRLFGHLWGLLECVVTVQNVTVQNVLCGMADPRVSTK